MYHCISNLMRHKMVVAGSVMVIQLFVFSLLNSDALKAGELVLVEDGMSRAPVVIFEDAPPKTHRAAEELVEYMEKISGVRPELIEGEPDPLPEHAVWVGYQPVLRDLFGDLDFDFEHPEEILISANENHLAILGRDIWNPEHMSVQGPRHLVEGAQQEYGTINAVYTFLQDFLNVRWLWPGETGIDIIEQKTLAFEPFEYRYHPQVRGRGCLLIFSHPMSRSGYGHSKDWMRFQRLLYDSLSMHGCHAFSDWWERFNADHPDYFALQPDGTRSAFPSARAVKLCQSNPDVWAQWLEEIERQLAENPNLRVFNAGPNDGWHAGHCVCENCLAWDHPEGEVRRFLWQGLSQQYVAMSDRHITFANKLAKKLKERFPDENYYARTLAYGHSRPAPLEAVPDDNVIVSSVANFFIREGLADRGSPQGTLHRDQFAAWAEIAPNLAWRPNAGSDIGWQAGLPNVPLRQTIDDFDFVFRQHRAMAIYIDSVWEHWATQGPLYYLMGQLTWNPEADGRGVLADYYERGFGPAAELMAAYWTYLEDARERYHHGHYDALPQVYNDEFFTEANNYLDQAEDMLTDEQQIYLDRVEFVRMGLDYTDLYIDNIVQMGRYQDSGETDEEAAERVRHNFKRQEDIARSEKHPHAIHWGPIRHRRGAHPDDKWQN